MDSINYKARAKINISLDVLGKLDNGYHEVKMVMQTISLHDELCVRKSPQPDILLHISSRDSLGDVHDNLIYKAASLMRGHFGIEQGLEIDLKKNIPVAAGMAGGSADAAATMLAMNELFELNQKRDELARLALPLGADIPFCIMGGTALAEGIGERLTPLPAPPSASLVVVKPPIMVSTGMVYESLDLNGIERHPDVDGMVQAIRDGDLNGITQRMENVMETVTQEKYPIIADIKKMLVGNGAKGAMMSGSGPSIFGVFTDKETAAIAADYVRDTLAQKGIDAQIELAGFYNEDECG